MADYSGYTYQVPDEETQKNQKEEWQKRKNPLTISLVVPAYETKPIYLTALIDSDTCPDLGKLGTDSGRCQRR